MCGRAVAIENKAMVELVVVAVAVAVALQTVDRHWCRRRVEREVEMEIRKCRATK